MHVSLPEDHNNFSSVSASSGSPGGLVPTSVRLDFTYIGDDHNGGSERAHTAPTTHAKACKPRAWRHYFVSCTIPDIWQCVEASRQQPSQSKVPVTGLADLLSLCCDTTRLKSSPYPLQKVFGYGAPLTSMLFYWNPDGWISFRRWKAVRGWRHIDSKLQVVLPVLQHFTPLIQGRHVLVRNDNHTAMAYINRQGKLYFARLLTANAG